MRVEDLILVSVDDHVVEPPTMFENHVPARWKDQAPKSVRKVLDRLRQLVVPECASASRLTTGPE